MCEKNITKESSWNISIIRRNFMLTAVQQLEDAEDSDWSRKINVTFIGEEGVDAGGLSREFFPPFFLVKILFLKMVVLALTLSYYKESSTGQWGR